MKTQLRALRLLSLNVNGLNCLVKRQALFAAVLQKGFDVVLLQETHHESESEGLSWAEAGAWPHKSWSGPSFWSHGTSSSRGVAVLVREGGLAENPVCTHNSSDGRICSVTFQFLGKTHTVINVYAPSNDTEHKKRFFLQDLLPCLPAHNCRVLVGGDFNCIGSGLDCTQGSAASRVGGFEGGLQVVTHQHNLLDVWRAQHGKRSGFTHKSTAGTWARLDRWYSSQDLATWAVAQRRPVVGLPGDHLGVQLELRPPQPSFRGPSSWTFSNSLLSQAGFKQSVRQRASSVLDSPLSCFEDSHSKRWEHLKNVLRLFSRDWQSRVAREEQTARRVCSEAATRAYARWEGNPDCPAALEAFQEAQSALQEHSSKQASRAALHAGLVDQHWGERSSAYFWLAAKIREAQTSFPAIRASTADTAFPLNSSAACEKACNIVADFYSGDTPDGLYRKRETDSLAQAELLECLDCVLSREARELAESTANGRISLAELTAALEASARGSAPGLDGLTYEFFREFWDLLGPALAAMLDETFSDPEAALPASLTEGRITLLHKQGKDKTLPDSYRPITLLNVDYKLTARVIARRLGPALNTVVDPTQTAFLPDRWIGDNVSAHLEEMNYLEEAGEPGVVVFLDFEKAFDRVDRDFTAACLARLGFGPHLQRWVSLLHTNTRALVNVNGHHTRRFPIRCGVFQGSPLSPLLYVATTQPMSAHARAQGRRGLVQAISLPDGSPAPLLHLHADDTSLHTRTRAGAAHLLDTTVKLHCLASAAQLQRCKSQGLEVGGSSSGVDATTGIAFIGPGEFVKHLGIVHSHDREADAERMYKGLLQRLESRIHLWCIRNLSLVGRVYVAKQVLVSMLTYLAGFVSPPAAQQRHLLNLVYTFIAKNRCADPDTPSPSSMFPRRAVACLPESEGGLGMTDVLVQIASLQAKLVARWLEPARLPWKAFFDQWVFRSPEWLRAHPAVPARRHDKWRLGRFLPFSAYPLRALQVPRRVLAHLTAHASLKSHRLSPAQHLHLTDCLTERLFYNKQITDAEGKSLQGVSWEMWVQEGVVSLGAWKDHSRLHRQHLPRWEVLLSALPARFKEALLSPVAFQWYMGAPCPMSRQPVVLRVTEGLVEQFCVLPSGKLETKGLCRHPVELPQASQAAVVMEWDETRPHRGQGTYELSPQGVPFLLGPLSSVTFIPALWGRGTFPAHTYVVKQATRRRLQLNALTDKKLLLQPGQALRPKIWSKDPSSPLDALTQLEAHWAGAAAAGVPRRTELLPAIFLPSAPRRPPRDRSQASQAAPHTAVPATSSSLARPADEQDTAESHAPPDPAVTQVWRELCQPDIYRPHGVEDLARLTHGRGLPLSRIQARSRTL